MTTVDIDGTVIIVIDAVVSDASTITISRGCDVAIVYRDDTTFRIRLIIIITTSQTDGAFLVIGNGLYLAAIDGDVVTVIPS